VLNHFASPAVLNVRRDIKMSVVSGFVLVHTDTHTYTHILKGLLCAFHSFTMASRDDVSRTPTPSNGPVQLGAAAAQVAHSFSHSPPAQPDQTQDCLPHLSKPYVSAQPDQTQDCLPDLSKPSYVSAQASQAQNCLPRLSNQIQIPGLPQHDRIHALINRFIEIGEGINRVEEWAEYHTLTLTEWRELRILAEPTLEEYNLRPDYDPDRQELAIRMPTTRLHDKTAKFAITLILTHLRNHVAEAAEFEIDPCLQLKFYNHAEKYPDYAIYDNIPSYYPQLVLELGYSNKPTPRLAEHYLRGSGGHIRTAVAFNLRYGEGAVKQHSVVVYRLELDHTAHPSTSISADTHVLREYNTDGSYQNRDGSVHFRPSDFGIDGANGNDFTIPFKEFLDAADRAEFVHNIPIPPPRVSFTEQRRHPMTTRSIVRTGAQ
jgi:hypothetical protein